MKSQHFASRGLQSRAASGSLNASGMHGATFRPPVRVPMHVVLALLDQCPSDTVTRKFAIFCLVSPNNCTAPECSCGTAVRKQ